MAYTDRTLSSDLWFNLVNQQMVKSANTLTAEDDTPKLINFNNKKYRTWKETADAFDALHRISECIGSGKGSQNDNVLL